MIYTDFKGEKISQLGFGTMRLPVINGVDKDIDEEKALEMFDYAYKHGINYFDTAWGYHEENAEIVVGKALSRYPRESFHLTTKFPGYDRNNFPKVKEIFAKQLEKLLTEYFDFYLFHNVCEYNIENYLNPEFGVKEYLVSEREAGRIKHLGFSDHSGIECFKRFLDAYGDVIEFCQIQLNWLDWDFQEAKEKVRILNEKKIPIIVMEPLRGGTLVEPAGGAEASFRFLQSIPGVVTILSGMSNLEQMQENIRIFETDAPMDDAAKTVLFEKAKKNLDEHIYEAHSLEEAKQLQAEHGGFIKTMWCGELECELKMKEEGGMSSRCMPLKQEHLGDTCPICGKPAKKMIYWGIAY